jgi:sortase A
VIAGHRWKYLPPNNTTFYLLDKVKIGDTLSVTWQNKKYVYIVKDIKIVDSNDTTLLQPTKTPTLTVYTCTPIYSTKHRLVLIAEPEIF